MLKLEIEEIVIEEKINPNRVKFLNDLEYQKGAVVYWMQRDQRACDNPALLYAQELALKNNVELIVAFANVKKLTLRRYDFMAKGLKEIKKSLANKNIPFYVMSQADIAYFLEKHEAGALITDFNPLKFKLSLENELLKELDIPFRVVDSHNICPCFYVSEKREYAARTIRTKIQRNLIEFLTEYPSLKKMPVENLTTGNWDEICRIDNAIKPIDWLKSGEREALKVLDDFIENKLEFFKEKRNNPNENVSSNFSAYLNFGQISANRIAIEVIKSNASKENKEAFLEELIVRKELSDNHCYYDKNYDSVDGFDNWAKQTLEEHNQDVREYIYTKEELENANTHDKLWNAAQIEMVKTGKMHGFMRMYWAKKILEWTKNYKQAFEIALYLNDKYELDGCDPNGYVGVAWSIGGVHDRAWAQREVFGKIRYMSYNGCQNKFDIKTYVNRIEML